MSEKKYPHLDDPAENARRINRENLLKCFLREREKQKYSPDFDALNTQNDWALFMCAYASRAFPNSCKSGGAAVAFIKVGALALAALEALQANGTFPPRAYEDHPECDAGSIPAPASKLGEQ
jgi:hypothetical protein